jgi:hypothetical protein
MAKQADAFPTTSKPVKLPAKERKRIEAEIQTHLDAADALIGSLDARDGDPDLEPSLGSLDRYRATYGNPGGDQTGWAFGNRDEREDEHDGLEPDVDDEPALGWPEDVNQARALRSCLHSYAGEPEPSLGALGAGYDAERFDQRRWSEGSRKDLEDEHDGREPDVDDEPSLASPHGGQRPEFFDQREWARGEDNDVEEACEDEGAQCEDEGACETAPVCE